MFIKEFKLDRYGPLRFKESIKVFPFTLFFGQNEVGKSLTIDAFVKLLFGKKADGFNKINRVDEYPYGYLVVNVDGKNLKLPEKGGIQSNIRDVDIKVNDFKNVFTVRSSKLEIPDESNFFLEVTERLTGVKASIIDKIVKKIREISYLTPGNSFTDIRDVQLKTRIEKAGRVIEKIDVIIPELKSENFDRLVQKSVEVGERLKEINERLDNLRKAEKRDQYLRAISALSELKKFKGEKEKYKIYQEDIKQQWYDLLKERERLIKEFEANQNKLNNFIEEIDQLKEMNNKGNEELSILIPKMGEINKISSQIDDLIEKDSDLEKKRMRANRVFKPLIFVSIAVFLITVLLSILNHNLIFNVVSILFLGFSVAGFLGYRWKKADLKKSIRKLRDKLAKYGIMINSDDTRELLNEIQKYEDIYNHKKHEIDNLKNDLEVKNKIKQDLESNLSENRRKFNFINDSIDVFKDKYHVDNYKGYCVRLTKKQELDKRLYMNQTLLKGIFRDQVNNIDNDMSDGTEDVEAFWNGKIKDLEKYKDLAVGLVYSEKDFDSLGEEAVELQIELDDLDQKLEKRKRDLEDIEKEINNILRTGSDYIHLAILYDLERVKTLLSVFIEKNNKNREISMLAINIFNEIKRKKRAEITNLFSEKSDISYFYKNITGGKYQEVVYNSNDSKIDVRISDGTIMDVDKLSSGAFDQLYFSIRLALAKKLVGNKKGFFIMDDPFIRSDKQRLIKQLKTLESIVKMGWQILYFSAKDEVKDAINNSIKDVDILEMSDIIEER